MEIERNLENQLLTAAKIIEDQVDNEINELEKMDESDLEKIRRKRLEEMKKQVRQKDQWLQNGHGTYHEIADEKEFFAESKKSSNLVIHFFKTSSMRCEIVDKHLKILAAKHIECKFLKLNVERAPFLTERLKIKVIPSIALIKDSKTKDYIVGFDDLGGHDEFSTKMMEWRIAQSGVIEYSGDLMVPPDGKSKNKGILGVQRKKNVRVGATGDDSSDNDDW